MKKLLALMLLMSVLVFGCTAQVKTVDVGGGPGIAVVLDEGTQKKFDDGMSKIEEMATTVKDILPVIASTAKIVGELSGNEDIGEKADDVADAAEKGAAGLGVLLAIGMLLKNIVKKKEEG